MKKLIATLFVATLGFSLVAVAQTYSLKDGLHKNGFSVLEPVQYDPSTNTTTYAKSNLKLDYTVSGSVNRFLKNADGTLYNGTGKTNFDLGHVYFTAHDNFRMALFVDIDSNQTPNELFIDSELKLNDYGIYLYENNDPSTNHITEYISLKNGDVEIREGMNFGVYYNADTTYGERSDPKYNKTYDMSDEMGKTDTKGETYTTARNWVASYDWAKDGNHNVLAQNAWYSDSDMASREAIFCMFQGPYAAGTPAYLEWQHVEFGFVTTDQMSGQPLPGTLATLLISGLCAGALRKRNKK